MTTMIERPASAHTDYPHIFTPLTIRGKTWKNRIVGAPVTTNRVVEHGYPTPDGIYEYESRARGGYAQITLTESFVDDEYALRHEHGLRIYSDDMTTMHMESIMTLTEAIKAHGAIASIQLNHVGGVNHPDSVKDHRNPIGPSAFTRPDGIQVDEMDEAMMVRVAANYASSALRCKKLGFDMVMLHGGHGWLLSQFISPLSNHRDDEFGGLLANRARFPLMVIRAIKQACGEDFLIEYRVSGAERVPGGMEIKETADFCKLIQHDVDLIHVTAGIYHSGTETKAFSSMFDAHGCNLDLAAAIKQVVDTPVVAVGGFNSPEQIEQAIASGQCDLVALGRQQFADPEFVNKARDGRADEIAPCLRCSCFNPLPANPGERPIPPLWSCTVNPLAHRGLRWASAPAPRASRRVLVIGGGPAGMYAAITAADRGHRVTLVDQQDQLGGILTFTDVDHHKESLRRYRDSLKVRLARSGSEVILGTRADAQWVTSFAPDAVICAIGSDPVIPRIEGIEHAHHALWVYEPQADLGKSVVVIGGGLIGCETGLWLAEEGYQVHLLEARDDLAIEGRDSHRRALLPRVRESCGYTLNVKVTGVVPGAVSYQDVDGEEHTITADSVIYAVGQRARAAEVEALRTSCAQFTVIGDARRARQVEQAVYEGFCAAMDIC